VGGNSVPNRGFSYFQSTVSFLRKEGGSETRVIILNEDGLNVVQLQILSTVIFEGGVSCLEN